MPEIGTSGLMSGDGKQGDAGWPKPLRPSSTLPYRMTWNTGRASCDCTADSCNIAPTITFLCKGVDGGARRLSATVHLSRQLCTSVAS